MGRAASWKIPVSRGINHLRRAARRDHSPDNARAAMRKADRSPPVTDLVVLAGTGGVIQPGGEAGAVQSAASDYSFAGRLFAAEEASAGEDPHVVASQLWSVEVNGARRSSAGGPRHYAEQRRVGYAFHRRASRADTPVPRKDILGSPRAASRRAASDAFGGQRRVQLGMPALPPGHLPAPRPVEAD